jgi:hypothetical protein
MSACRSRETGIKKFFCGPESFTPDLRRASARPPSSRTTSSPPASTRSASSPAAAWAASSRTGSSRPPRRRRHRLAHRSPAHLPGQPRVPPHPHGRVARHGLPVPLPDALDADRARRQASACTSGSRRAARTSRTSAAGRAPTGTRRPGIEPDPVASSLGPAELVRRTGPRAPGRARGRDPDGHVVHGEVPGAGPRRRGGARLDISANKSTAPRASSPTRSGSTRAARSRPTSP